MLQHLGKYQADLVLQDLFHIICGDGWIFCLDPIHPVRMLLQHFITTDVSAFQDSCLQRFHLSFQAGRKYRQPHYFDQTDIFFLYVMQFCMGMIYAQGMLLCSDIISQHQIHLKIIASFSGYGSDGVVRFSVCLRKDKCRFIGVASPRQKDPIRQLDQAVGIRSADADHGHGPFHNACLYVLKSRNRQFRLHRSLRHGKFIMAALEMIVAQNGTAHNGKIRIGTHKIMGKLFYKVKQLCKGGTFNLHGHMLAVKHDAVLIIIYIGRILEIPAAVIDRNRNDPVILSGRMIQPSCISLVFTAQQTFGVRGLLRQLSCGNGLGIFLRLGQVDCNIQIAVLRFHHPFAVLHYAVTADIVCILAEFVVEIRSFYRILLIKLVEFADHIAGTIHQRTHQLCIKQVPVSHAVLFHQAGLIGIIT